MSFRPPSTSPSPSPAPHDTPKNSRQSLGPTVRGTPGLAPSSPRPGGARPTSELLGGSGMFQTPEAEALDQWFENLQNYEATLEEMAAASLDLNFKEELSAIEQWFKVLSEAERTAALYSLLQHSTQVQIRFFITVLQQMARSDPMTALLSPAMGGSMQNQMEAKLASLNLKSPGLMPSSPTGRNFANRQSLVLDSNSNFLSPDSAALSKEDPAQTLAQQRAKLKASNAAHRISAPVLSTGDGRSGGWPAGSQLTQVTEANGGIQDTSARPKSTEFSGSPRPAPAANNTNEVTVSNESSWASMVNTPLIPMFQKESRLGLDAAATKLNEWNSKNAAPGVPRMGDPTVHRRTSKANEQNNGGYDDPRAGGQNRNNGQSSNSNGNFGGGAGWTGARSPALSNSSSNRFNDDLTGLGMQMGGFGMGMGSPGLGMGMGMGMAPGSPFNNMNMLSAMGITPETLLAAQMAAAQGFGQPGWMGMQPNSAGLGSAGLGSAGRRAPANSIRSAGPKSAWSAASGGATPKGEEDVDPQLLTDIPAWLRSLRLHKYTPNFETMKWQDMVMMDDAALEAKGVAALGARRKMLKTFELVRKKMGIEGGPSVPASATL